MPRANRVISGRPRGARRAGASGYLLKEAIDSELVTAIRAVAQGQAYLSPAISSTVLADSQKPVSDPLDTITPRERPLLQMLAEGKSSKDIGLSGRSCPPRDDDRARSAPSRA